MKFGYGHCGKHWYKTVTTLEVDTLYVNYISTLQFEIPTVVDYAMCYFIYFWILQQSRLVQQNSLFVKNLNVGYFSHLIGLYSCVGPVGFVQHFLYGLQFLLKRQYMFGTLYIQLFTASPCCILRFQLIILEVKVKPSIVCSNQNLLRMIWRISKVVFRIWLLKMLS